MFLSRIENNKQQQPGSMATQTSKQPKSQTDQHLTRKMRIRVFTSIINQREQSAQEDKNWADWASPSTKAPTTFPSLKNDNPLKILFLSV
jgi:hypothetical protein